MNPALPARRPPALPSFQGSSRPISHLTDVEANALTRSFQEWFDSAQREHVARARGRYWLTYLVLRFTGCRLGEARLIDDSRDIDFRQGEIRLATLKRHKKNATKNPTRIVPVPLNVTSEIATYLAQYPDMKGRIFGLQPGNFRARFYELAAAAGIPRDNAHPHILRHTRAMELLRAGVPVTVVQDLLGHSALTTTAIYLRMSGQEARSVLRDKGMI